MKTFIVLYYPAEDATEVPEAFRCEADNSDHAEEQCENAYPDCNVVWVYEGDNSTLAYDNYWHACPGQFEYFIDCDERGEFRASLRRKDSDTVLWEFNGDVFEEGYMRDKNDLDGLQDYLLELGIMEKGDTLVKGQ